MYHYDQMSSATIWNSLWTPEKEVVMENVREITLKHDPFSMLSIFPEKYFQEVLGQNEVSVIVTWEMQINLFCHFKFRDFPLDTQRCKFQLTNKDAQYLQLILPDKKIPISDWPAPNLYKNSEQNSTISEMGDFFKY